MIAKTVTVLVVVEGSVVGLVCEGLSGSAEVHVSLSMVTGNIPSSSASSSISSVVGTDVVVVVCCGHWGAITVVHLLVNVRLAQSSTLLPVRSYMSRSGQASRCREASVIKLSRNRSVVVFVFTESGRSGTVLRRLSLHKVEPDGRHRHWRIPGQVPCPQATPSIRHTRRAVVIILVLAGEVEYHARDPSFYSPRESIQL